MSVNHDLLLKYLNFRCVLVFWYLSFSLNYNDILINSHRILKARQRNAFY